MKKFGFTHRALALVLVLVMVLQVLPMGALAAVGDFNTGDTGIVNSTLGKGGTISWPIKVYDYLNDGMLFECAQGYADAANKYGGGQNMPVTKLGTDFTVASSPGNNGAFYTSIQGNTGAWGVHRYLRVTRPYSPTGNGANVALISFTSAQTPAKVRYIAMVYRSKGVSTDVSKGRSNTDPNQYSSVQFNIYGSNNGAAANYFRMTLQQGTSNTWTNSPTEWTYMIIDLADMNSSVWSKMTSISTIYLRNGPIESNGYLDISHIACFSSTFEAEQYAKDALAFNADPGEYLGVNKTINISTGDTSTEVTGNTFPYASAPNYRFTTKHVYNTLYTYFTHGNGDSTKAVTTNIYHGLNFTISPPNSYEHFSAYNTTTYKTWATGTTTTIESTLYSSGVTTTPLQVTEKEQTSQSQKYVTIQNKSGNTEENRILLMNLREDYGDVMAGTTTAHQNVVLIYRTHNLVNTEDYFGFWAYGGSNYNATSNYVLAGVANATDWQKASNTTALQFGQSGGYGTQSATPLSGSFSNTNDQWVYQIVNFADAIRKTDAANMNAITYVKHVGLYLPALTGDKSIDLAYVGFFGDSRLTEAREFAEAAVAYMNSNLVFDNSGNLLGTNTGTSSGTASGSSFTLSNRTWNQGNNIGFGLYHASQDGSNWAGHGRPDNSSASNYYASFRLGFDTRYNTNATNNSYKFRNEQAGLDAWYFDANGNPVTTPASGTKTNKIYFTAASSIDDDNNNGGYSTNHLDLDGYKLLTLLTQGGMSVGLLEHGLVDGRPVYRQETVEYVADLLYKTLIIPPFDADGDYNYNYVKGSTSSQFAIDLNGNGTVGDKLDLNGDGYKETDEAKLDLATALRYCLGIQFTIGKDKGAFARTTGATDSGLGTYAATEAKAHGLIGTFSNCRGNIRTCMDAAYFLLNNIFVENSYNQKQNDYGYLVLSHATMDSGKEAYVFDAGYSTGDSNYSTENKDITASTAYNSSSALQYSPFSNGNGTISLGTVGSKDLFYYGDTAKTTRFPFLPVTSATGEYAGETKSPYYVDPGVMGVSKEGDTYVNRNYNYVMQANGEFLFDADDDLFFEFEGDDDVYLFINNELVLDIGGAHSITNVAFNMNDYVEMANDILSTAFSSYRGDMTDEEFETLLTGSSLTDAVKEEYRRWHKLNLQDGMTYAIDFYYMERHGTGANCRIVTNIIMSDPSLQTEKTAYQNGEEVEYGGVVTTDAPVEYSFSMSNAGNSKLYKLSFSDPTIGVTMDWENGLTFDETKYNANKILNGSNGKLTAQDLVFTITGYKDEAKSEAYDPITVTGLTNDQLKALLYDLATPNNDTQFGEGSTLFSGSGLWRHATLAIRGIYYKLDSTDTASGNTIKNTVYINASPAVDSETVIKGETNHLVRVIADAIQFYQWAGHEVGLHRQHIFDQFTQAVKNSLFPDVYVDKTNSNTPSSGWFYMDLCNAKGTIISLPDVTVNDSVDDTKYPAATGNQGTQLNINYQNPGKYTFYLKVWRSATNAPGNLEWYAILPVIVYVTDVKDDTIVLDYGLPVDLTADGGIFANDYLTPSTDSRHRVMGIQKTSSNLYYQKYGYNKTQGSYGSYQLYNDNRIIFDHNGAEQNNTVIYRGSGTVGKGSDGKYTLNSDGSLIFKPIGFMDENLTIYTAITVYDKDLGTPSPVGTANTYDGAADTLVNNRMPIANASYTIDVSKEVQMYNKIDILPASVVYYEDDFVFNNGLSYTNSSNGAVFEKVGSGSGSLSQSINQNTPYGQDAAYQNATEYSGNSLTKIKITKTGVQATFAFKGTGFELIGRTNAKDSATIVVEVLETKSNNTCGTGDYDGDGVDNYHKIPVITEFDNDGNGGDDAIYQVPVVRVNGLKYGEYTVKISGNPSYDFTNWDGTGTPPIVDSYLYIDGFRIYQPMNTNRSEYLATENKATFTEMRDLVASGQAAVAQVGDGLKVSSGTLTWTEDLHGNYEGGKVTSSNDYLLAGPNNELYMDGSVTNSAVALYVQEDANATAHSMQIAVRALNYALFYGAGSNKLNAQIQYGVKSGTGYTWKTLTTITSGTEQYYTIPYTECPYVSIGNSEYAYQVVLRATTVEDDIPVLVSYTTLKTVGLTLKTVTGNGEASIMKYSGGILLKPDYFLYGKIDGVTVSSTSENYKFTNGELKLTVKSSATLAVRRDIVDYMTLNNGKATTSTVYYEASASTDTTLNAVSGAGKGKKITLSAGTYTLKVTQTQDASLTLTGVSTASGEDVEVVAENENTVANLYSLRAQMLADTTVADTETVVKPTLDLIAPSLNFEDEVYYNVYYSASDLTDVVEMGLITFDSYLENGTIDDAAEVITGYVTSGDNYMVHSNGIPAKMLGDTLYFRVYAKLSDGTYVYSDVAGYNAVAYAQDILANSTNADMKALVVAMLNYGAAAQVHFDHKTDALMNAFLSDEQKALVSDYSADMVESLTVVDSTKAAQFAGVPGGYTHMAPSVAFEGAFAINFYFTPAKPVAGDLTLYYWTLEDYNAAQTLTYDNASGVVVMAESGTVGKYVGVAEGIAAKEIDQTVFVAGVYESDGVLYSTGVIAYSLAAYCQDRIANGSETMQEFAADTIVYGYYAKTYFANLD